MRQHLRHPSILIWTTEKTCCCTQCGVLLLYWQSKKSNIATSKIKKKNNSFWTLELLFLGAYAPGPQVLTYRSQNLRRVLNLNSVPGSGFRARNGELKDSWFWARMAITLRSGVLDRNQLHIRIPCTRNPTPHTSWYPQVFSGKFKLRDKSSMVKFDFF